MGLEDANSSEFQDHTKNPVIDLLPEQYRVKNMGGTMRLGSIKVLIKDGTIASRLYRSAEIYERHRHRYEVNPSYMERINRMGMNFSGTYDEKIRMEILELNDRDNYIATQYHSEFKSRPLSPSKVHMHLVLSALEYRRKMEGVKDARKNLKITG